MLALVTSSEAIIQNARPPLSVILPELSIVIPGVPVLRGVVFHIILELLATCEVAVNSVNIAVPLFTYNESSKC